MAQSLGNYTVPKFLLRKVASHFTPSFTTAKLHAECELTVHVLQIINFSLGPGQFWPRPNVWTGSGPAQKRERKYVRPRSAQPFWADIGPLFSGFVPGPVI